VFPAIEDVYRPDKDNNVETRAAPPCQDNDGHDGICVEISECPSVRETMRTKRPKICAWTGVSFMKPFICCSNDIAGETPPRPQIIINDFTSFFE
jgi:hypothetical protein